MALTLAECDDMIAAAERNSVLLQLGFMRRFDPDFQAAASRNRGGRDRSTHANQSSDARPGAPSSLGTRSEESNGMLAEVNSHDWDAVRWLAQSDPERTYAQVSNFKGATHGVETPHFYDTAL